MSDWRSDYAAAVESGNTVNTFDEVQAWRYSEGRDTYIFAGGRLAEQVRERLGFEPDAPVRVGEAYDFAKKAMVTSLDCGVPGEQFKDMSFLIYDLADIEYMRAWVEGREPIIQADFPRRDEEKRAIRITLTEALTKAAESGSTNLWEAIENGIFPESWAWSEQFFISPPAGMYDLWYRAVDLILPIIGIDREQFEHAYDMYHCWNLPPLDAWTDKPAEEVRAILLRAIEAEQESEAAA